MRGRVTQRTRRVGPADSTGKAIAHVVQLRELPIKIELPLAGTVACLLADAGAQRIEDQRRILAEQLRDARGAEGVRSPDSVGDEPGQPACTSRADSGDKPVDAPGTVLRAVPSPHDDPVHQRRRIMDLTACPPLARVGGLRQHLRRTRACSRSTPASGARRGTLIARNWHRRLVLKKILHGSLLFRADIIYTNQAHCQ